MHDAIRRTGLNFVIKFTRFESEGIRGDCETSGLAWLDEKSER